MVKATEEFLRRLSVSFVAGGTISRRAIGTMIKRYACSTVRPVEAAASN